MKTWYWIGVLVAGAITSHAQPNAPVRLALIAETEETRLAADLLTAALANHPALALLERNDIDKARREQGLSAANRDEIQLGRILGADGLLLLDVLRTAQTTNLAVRLIAVKPGVVLTAARYPWPLSEASRWEHAAAAEVEAFRPKLALLPRNAIPISVVNLRSATASAAAVETERALKLLTIHRLSREPQFFVLERQKMGWLGEEKNLTADESAFWSGSYLLEGVVDQNGVSKDILTINARLTPPKGGAAMACEASGPRTNLAEVVNRLIAQVVSRLQLKSSAPVWKPADEAANFLEEAKWALRWRLYPEAQSAADSAWALGQTGLDCALLCLDAIREELFAKHYMIAKFGPGGDRFNTEYVYADAEPDPLNLDRAIRLLEHYDNLSHSHPEDLSATNATALNPQNATWQDAGIKALEAASGVLKKFHALPEWPPPVAEKLRDLRAQARSVAQFLTQSPAVHDAYFIGDRPASHEDIEYLLGRNARVFSSLVNWGAYWQETAPDTLALYRGLMASPVFSYVHTGLWLRGPDNPRLAAWNSADRAQLPQVWQGFVDELAASTNLLWRWEAKAFALADATNPPAIALAFTNLFNALVENRAALATNRVEILGDTWGLEPLIDAKFPNQKPPGIAGALEVLRSCAADWSRNVAAREHALAFAGKKAYLQAHTPYEFFEFARLFGDRRFTPAEARELQPLIAAYRTNLAAGMETLPAREKGRVQGALAQVGFLERDVNRIASPEAVAARPAPPRASATTNSAPAPGPARPAETLTNIIGLSKFLPIPLESLGEITAAGITAHHWQENKLVLDLRCQSPAYRFDQNGKWNATRPVTLPAVAILDPATEQWRIIGCSELDLLDLFGASIYYHHTAIWRGEVFSVGDKQINRYDTARRKWQPLEISDGGQYQLFNVNDHLYAANSAVVLEILDDGKSTRILASTRRRPPVSALDTEDLGTPTLFAGLDHSLRVAARNQIFAWTGNDWRALCATPPASFPPVVSDDGVLFVTDDWDLPACVSYLPAGSDAATFALGNLRRPRVGGPANPGPPMPKPAWKLPRGVSLAGLASAVYQSNLYLLLDHSTAENVIDPKVGYVIGKNVLARDGYHAALLCFTPNLPEPQRLYLRFDRETTHTPLTGPHVPGPVALNGLQSWLLFGGDYLFAGREIVGPNFGEYAPLDGSVRTGIWMIPKSQLEPEIAAQRQAQAAQRNDAAARVQDAWPALLAKYDQNHNGVLDPEEKEAALADPAFIECQLDQIDTNHDGWLQPAELFYFDANHNQRLDPPEQAGLEAAQRLLAARLMEEFDANGDGVLDRSEFDALYQARFTIKDRPSPSAMRPFPDEDHDTVISPTELEHFLQQQTRESLRPGGHGVPSPLFLGGPPNTSPGFFKTLVEAYWQNPAILTNRPSMTRPRPPGAAQPPADPPTTNR